MTTLLTTESKKAWVAGVLTALLTPALNLVSGADVLTLRALVIAVISGILGAVAVWATDNADPRSTAAADTAPATGARTAIPVQPIRVADDPTPDDPSDDFTGQSITGL